MAKLANIQLAVSRANVAYLFLSQVVGEIGNHDLVLGGNTVGRRSALTALTSRALLGGLVTLVSVRLVGDVGQR